MQRSSQPSGVLKYKVTTLAALICAHAMALAEAAPPYAVLPEVFVQGKRLPASAPQPPILGSALADWLGPLRPDQQAWSQNVIKADELRQVNRVEDALAIVPGVQVANDGSGISSAVMMRGFKTTSLLMGGLPEMQWRFARDPYTAERLEVLSGPQGVMLGQTAPGGTLHWVPKLADGRRRLEVGAGLDSDGWGRAWLDLNTPASATVSTRLVLAAQDGSTQPQSLSNRRAHVLTSVRVAPSAALSATAWLEYQDTRRPWIFGTVIPNEATGQVRYDQLYVVKGGLPAQRETRQGGLVLQSQVGDHWTLSSQWREGELHRYEEMLGFWSTTANPQLLSGYYARFHDDWQQSSSQLKALGQWQGPDWSGSLALGWDQLHASREFFRLQSRMAFNIDVDTNDYSQVNVFALPLSPTDLAEQWDDHSAWVGSQWVWQDRTRLTLGWRQGQTQRDLQLNSSTTKTTADQVTRAWQVGLSHDMTPMWTAYGSRSTATQANSGHTLNGAFLPALQAAQTEFGLHAHADRGQGTSPWNAHVAVFKLVQSNLPVPDPSDPAREAVMSIGRWQATGIEASGDGIAGQWEWQWQLSHQTFLPLVKTSAAMGDTPVGAAQDLGAIRLARTLSGLGWQPLSCWAQVQATGPTQANTSNTVRVKGHERLDIGAQWALPAHGSLSLTIRNVTDRRYVEAINGTDDVYQGPRRDAWVAANWAWK